MRATIKGNGNEEALIFNRFPHRISVDR